MNEIKRKPGFAKGTPKPAGSGIKKGQKHKAKRIKEELRSSPNMTQERYEQLMNQAWDLAMYEKNTSALSIWKDEYNKIIDRSDKSMPEALMDAEVETLEDINKVAKLVTKKMLRKQLTIPVAKQVLEGLSACKAFEEALLDPQVKQLLDEQIKQSKGIG